MRRPLFLPTARQTNWLLIVAFLSVGEAMYLRYMAIENLNVELACQAGLKTWLCSAFRVSIVLYNHYVFGGVGARGRTSQSAAAVDRAWSRWRLRPAALASCCTMPSFRRSPPAC